MARVKVSFKPSKARIQRAVASSTAIETGKSVAATEAKLKASTKKYQNLTLAG